MAYRAPEMIDLYRKQLINEKVDIWALGVMLYKLAYFVHPFDEDSSLGILNMRYEIPEDSPFSDTLVKMIRKTISLFHILICIEFMLVADPAQRPDIYAVLAKVASIRHGKYERKTPAKRTQAPPTVVEPEVAPLPTKAATAASTSGNVKLFDILDWQDSSDVPPTTTPIATPNYSPQPSFQPSPTFQASPKVSHFAPSASPMTSLNDDDIFAVPQSTKRTSVERNFH
jgi:AP2-associated kinase